MSGYALWRRLGAFLVLVLTCAWSPVQGPYQGRFAAGHLALELTQSADTVTGAILIRKEGGTLEGVVADGGLRGTFEFGGKAFSFDAAFDPKDWNVLVLTSGGQSHRLARSALPANPLVPTEPRPRASEPSDPASPEALDQALIARFPMIFEVSDRLSIRHPGTWSQSDLGLFQLLIPPPPPDSIVPLSTYYMIELPIPIGMVIDAPAVAMLANQALTGIVQDEVEADEMQLLGRSVFDGVRLRRRATRIGDIELDVSIIARPTRSGLLVMLGLGEQADMDAQLETIKSMIKTIVVKPAAVDKSEGRNNSRPATPDEDKGPLGSSG